jgi:hypothetical protein
MNEKNFLIERDPDNFTGFVALENVTLCALSPTWKSIARQPGIPGLFDTLYYNHIKNDQKKKLRTIKRIGIVVQYDD